MLRLQRGLKTQKNKNKKSFHSQRPHDLVVLRVCVCVWLNVSQLIDARVCVCVDNNNNCNNCNNNVSLCNLQHVELATLAPQAAVRPHILDRAAARPG